MLRIVVFGSGRGSNFLSIVDAIEAGSIPVKIVRVIVNKSDALMIKKAQENYLEVDVIPHEGKNRAAHEQEILNILHTLEYDIICLAGYMRILSSDFIKNVDHPILNIHPSLLPSFPGLHAQQQAFEYGVKVTGCTVHLVNEDVDAGKILAQTCVLVENDDTVASLTDKILQKEHKLYPQVLFDIAMGNITLSND